MGRRQRRSHARPAIRKFFTGLNRTACRWTPCPRPLPQGVPVPAHLPASPATASAVALQGGGWTSPPAPPRLTTFPAGPRRGRPSPSPRRARRRRGRRLSSSRRRGGAAPSWREPEGGAQASAAPPTSSNFSLALSLGISPAARPAGTRARGRPRGPAAGPRRGGAEEEDIGLVGAEGWMLAAGQAGGRRAWADGEPTLASAG